MVQVKELQGLAIFKEITLIAGVDGIQNPLTSITIVETFDVASWLRGDEFLLMSKVFFALPIDQQLSAFKLLATYNVAAVGIKLQPQQKSFNHEAIIACANSYNIPLFIIPHTISYADIMGPVNRLLITNDIETSEIESFTKQMVFSDYGEKDYFFNQALASNLFTQPSAILPLTVYFKNIPTTDTHSKQTLHRLHRQYANSIINELSQIKHEGLINDFIFTLNYSELITFIMFKEKQSAAKMINRFTHFLDTQNAKYPQQFFAGVGSLQHLPFDFPLGYKEASKAYRIGSVALRAEKKLLFNYQDVAFFDLLNITAPQLQTYFSQHLDSCLNNDMMIETLSVYFEANENITTTSQKLFVHANSVRYRLEKIKTETGLDIHDMQAKLILYLYIISKRLL